MHIENIAWTLSSNILKLLFKIYKLMDPGLSMK